MEAIELADVRAGMVLPAGLLNPGSCLDSVELRIRIGM